MSERAVVAVAACASYECTTVSASVVELLTALGGLSTFVKPGQTVLIKPNLFSPHPPEHAVTTHPGLVRQVILSCVHAGAGRIWVGDSPVGLPEEAELWTRTGMQAAVAGTPAELKSWRTRQIPKHCGEDVLAVPEWFPEVDAVISLPKLKTHSLTTLTCGLKNVYGIVSGPAKSQFHVKYPSPLAMSGFLVRVFGTLRPTLTIADAVVAMEGNGPAHGRPRPVGVLLASRDAVALDAVACSALRIAPSTVPMITLAAASQLGCMDEESIECVGNGVATLQAARLRPSVARFLKYVPEPCYRLTSRMFRLRPKIKNDLCVRCGTCHDVCPRHAIEDDPRTGFPVIRSKKCIDCFCCAESCRESAIATRLYWGEICVGQQQRQKAGPS
ncbi:MAG: DUF362 domain-containing protein [Verrucomicrobiia bacterium]|jgi:uncharacterized protein (DUF362 family)/Pyruvate/2-oxoacid:ferredoxin oxidoreductase delta subunit